MLIVSSPYITSTFRGMVQERNSCLFKALSNGKIPVCEGKRQQTAQETERTKGAKMVVEKTAGVERC